MGRGGEKDGEEGNNIELSLQSLLQSYRRI